jgi:hypothetical protein
MKEIQKWRNLFEGSCGKEKLMIVWHGEDKETTKEWCERYPLVGLGGTASSSDEQMRTHKFIKQIVQQYPNNKFHLFALTSNDLGLYSSLGLYSADSTSWSLGSRFGLLYWYDSGRLKSKSKYFLRNDADRSDKVNFLAWLRFGNHLNGLGKFKDSDISQQEEKQNE